MNINNLFDVKGKVVLITGGSRGIGEMMASGFLANGAKVYISSRKIKDCDATAQRLSEKYESECISIPADISDLNGINELFTNFDKYLYKPTLSLVDYTRKLGVPVICFPRGIKNYVEFCKIVKPNMINIDYNIDPKKLLNDVDIPMQGGLDPKILLTDKNNLKNEVTKYLEIFNNHPYVFNLGHGILPETKIEMVEELVRIVKEFKWM